MALDLSIVDVELASLNISQSSNGGGVTLNFDADWQALDSLGEVIAIVGQQKDSESKLFSEYPQNVQDAVLTLNTYAADRIKTAKGII